MAPALVLFALALAIRETTGRFKDPALNWWGNYLVVYVAAALLVWVALYFFLPYFRHNSSPGVDTVGSRTLFPMLVSAFVGSAAFAAAMFERLRICKGE